MLNPDVWLDVGAEIGAAIDPQHAHPLGNDVVAGHRHRYPRPLFPLLDGPGHCLRLTSEGDDLSSQAHVEPKPRIKRKPVVSHPRRVILDGEQWIEVLTGRTHRREYASLAPGSSDADQRTD